MDSVAPSRGGLTAGEVAARAAGGRANTVTSAASRTFFQILRANVLTRFNAILGALFIVVLVVGPPQDGLFGVVLAVNTAMGVAQEIRAKRTLERLALLSAPTAHAVRAGEQVELQVGDVVVDDILQLRPGDQVVADGLVLECAGLEVDESMLTGEVAPVVKQVGDEVLSGSAIVAGTAIEQVTRVGPDAFAQSMQGEARRFSLVRSELQQGTNQILRLVTWVMIPAGALLVLSQVLRSGQSLEESLRGSVAGVGAMVPEGLVLLTTIAFALGALRLARRRVLVQELAAVEGLARVDVVCVDKTGTLTEPGIALSRVEVLAGQVAGSSTGAGLPMVAGSDGEALAHDALAAMAASDPAPNATMLAIRELPQPSGWRVEDRVPFSSERKWSAVQFAGRGSWVVGAPEMVLDGTDKGLAERGAVHTTQGRRVLLLARSDQPVTGDLLPGGLSPVALVVLEERVRPDAAATVGYLLGQGVAVKVVSGDDPTTVGAVARRLGIPGADDPLDARTLPSDPGALAERVGESSVFGRVRPNQKQAIVKALQARGHVVAMTGDGVNDVPSVKAADLGMAMGSGSQATRSVGRIVLLDDSFSVVPHILGEGRRVIANVGRVANLFVTKTVYAAVLAVVVGITAVPYPFYPRHLTIVSSLTIGLPGFLLALAPGEPRARPGFVKRVLRFTLPAGLVAAVVTLVAYLVAREAFGSTPAESRSVATLALLGISLAVLTLVARPLTFLRGLLVVAMALGVALVWLVPYSRSVFGLVVPSAGALAAVIAILVAAVPLLVLVVGVTTRSDPSGPRTAIT